MTIKSISLPLHMLNSNKDKRVGDRKGWPIQLDLTNLKPDLKTFDKRNQS